MGERDLMNQSVVHDVDRFAQAQPFLTAIPSCPSLPPLAEALADPRGAFRHPADVALHPALSHEEKRTILISWIRDELTLEQIANGGLPELKRETQIDAVIAALGWIDPHAAAEYHNAVASRRRRGSLRNG